MSELTSEARQWLERTGYTVGDQGLWQAALTHGSMGETQDYERRGYVVAGTRWRGQCGEIDLILRDGLALVFVEVKKSRSYDEAFRHLGWRQVRRLMAAAEEFAGGEPLGSLNEMRFDVALLDAQGRVRVVENAFGP